MGEVIWLRAKVIRAAMAAVEQRRKSPEARAALKRRLAAQRDGRISPNETGGSVEA